MLKRFLHFNDNTFAPCPTASNRDRLFKISAILQKIRENCLKIEREERYAVDEQIIPFKGTNHLKLYLPKKPNKWGFKVVSLNGVSGIVYDFEFYTGVEPPTVDGIGMKCADVVIRLCQSVPKHLNCKVFFDNYYNCFELQLKLQEMGIWTVGTLRKNRLRNCTLESEADLKLQGRGSYDYRTNLNKTKLWVVRWYDNRAVNLSSTYVGPHPIGSIERWDKKQRKRVRITQPCIVKEYNLHMGGVDKFDMLTSLYRLEHKSRRWYMRIFYWALQVAAVNGWLMYRRQCELLKVEKKERLDLLNFVASISESLIKCQKSVENQRQPGRPPSRNPTPDSISPLRDIQESEEPPSRRRRTTTNVQDDVRLDQIGHYPEYREKKSRCTHCSRPMRMGCAKCKVGLCVEKDRNCFLKFHTT
jgi:hypothetical protein